MRRIPGYWKAVIVTVTVLIVLNLVFLSRTVCDFYADHIFGWWTQSYARLTGIVPFSVGEVMIYLTIAALVVGLILAILRIPLRKRKRFCTFFRRYMKTALSWVLVVSLLITLNLTPLYRTTHMQDGEKSYSVSELRTLRNYLVTQCNALCPVVERDENGLVVASAGMTHAEITAQMQELLRAQVEDYPRLSGYYPLAKELWCSDLMYFINTIGVYFPFSMEANMSAYVNDTWYPYTVAHELCHVQGYIYEDEANFLAFLACEASDNAYIRYSGYLNVLLYVENDLFFCDEDYGREEVYTALNEQVYFDCTCYSPETVDAMTAKEEAIDDTPINAAVIEDISESMTDVYMEIYDSEANYSEVTGLLLEYFGEKGY